MNVLTILLLLISSAVAEPFIKSCDGDDGKNLTAEGRAYSLNHWRKELMNDIGISNMHELKYDFRLEDEIRKMKSCKDIVHGPNYRVEDHHDVKALSVMRDVTAKLRNSL